MADGNLNIFLSRNSASQFLSSADLIAIVEGITALSETDGSLQFLDGAVF